MTEAARHFIRLTGERHAHSAHLYTQCIQHETAFLPCRIFILFLAALTNTNTSPLRMLIPMLLFTMPLSPLKPMRMFTGLLYSQ